MACCLWTASRCCHNWLMSLWRETEFSVPVCQRLMLTLGSRTGAAHGPQQLLWWSLGISEPHPGKPKSPAVAGCQVSAESKKAQGVRFLLPPECTACQ